jgi:small neutral amino acid transporter SnatA (MarC family)
VLLLLVCAFFAAILLLVDKKENIDQLVAVSTEYSAVSIKIVLLVFSIYYLFVIGIQKYCGL